MDKERKLPSGKQERLDFIYSYLSGGIRAGRSKAPRAWLAQKGLSIDATGAGFNSGQIHHRADLAFKVALAEIGFMKKADVGVNCDTVPYTVFGIFSIMFPLRNLKNEVVNFYSIRIKSENTDYMNHEAGLYPGYPHELTKKLFVVNTILEAATILESKVLDNREAIIALHDGKVMPEHKEAIMRLTKLEEIVYIDSKVEKVIKESKVWDRSKK